MKPYLLSSTRMRIRGASEQPFKDLLRSWREMGGDVTIGPAGSMDLLGVSPNHFWRLAEKISADSRLFPVAEQMMNRLECAGARRWEIALMGGNILQVGERPVIMGIINVTPDSFSDGGAHFDHELAVEDGIKMAVNGADILDVGGESTRPGAAPVDVEEEKRRVIPVIEELAAAVKVPISIDTHKSEVARAALEAGAMIINDVTMLKRDPDLADVAAKFNAPLILSHILGTPQNMQQNPQYEDMWPEILDALTDAIEVAKRRGVHEDQIILDPGIGFGKKLEHNLNIINGLFALTTLGRPVLIGPSRKRFIGDVLGVDVDQRLDGTIAACVVSLMRGAAIFRVHDVLENRRALDIAHAILKTG